MDTGIELAVEAPHAVAGAADAVPAVVRVTGRLDGDTGAELAAGLRRLLREHGGVVADVSGLALDHAPAVHAVTDAVDQAGGWPAARLVLAAPGAALAAVLVASGVAAHVPVHPEVRTAVRRVDERPDVVRAFWHFSVDVRAPGAARDHVRRVCDLWDVDEESREAAEVVVTELVTNAVEHAGSASVVEVERAAGSFRLTVRDRDRAVLPDVRLPAPTSPRGRGLAMVAAVARDWGVDAHADGKTVWAEMTTSA